MKKYRFVMFVFLLALVVGCSGPNQEINRTYDANGFAFSPMPVYILGASTSGGINEPVFSCYILGYYRYDSQTTSGFYFENSGFGRYVTNGRCTGTANP